MWVVTDDNGHFVPMFQEIHGIVEQGHKQWQNAKRKGARTGYLLAAVRPDCSSCMFEFDFETMFQRNVESQVQRRIHRLVLPDSTPGVIRPSFKDRVANLAEDLVPVTFGTKFYIVDGSLNATPFFKSYQSEVEDAYQTFVKSKGKKDIEVEYDYKKQSYRLNFATMTQINQTTGHSFTVIRVEGTADEEIEEGEVEDDEEIGEEDEDMEEEEEEDIPPTPTRYNLRGRK
jgi:hypothetical protein